jgi:hypothetical protein
MDLETRTQIAGTRTASLPARLILAVAAVAGSRASVQADLLAPVAAQHLGTCIPRIFLQFNELEMRV